MFLIQVLVLFVGLSLVAWGLLEFITMLSKTKPRKRSTLLPFESTTITARRMRVYDDKGNVLGIVANMDFEAAAKLGWSSAAPIYDEDDVIYRDNGI